VTPEQSVSLLQRPRLRRPVDEVSPLATALLTIDRLQLALAEKDARIAELRAQIERLDARASEAAGRKAARALHGARQRALLQDIVAIVAEAAGLTQAALLSNRRSRIEAWPRQMAIFLVRRYCGLSAPEIGAAFDRDHTSVLHAVRTVEARLSPEIAARWPQTLDLHRRCLPAVERAVARLEDQQRREAAGAAVAQEGNDGEG
jgi:uncharacterized small protein (DUF1192 family)